ncbi:DegT/DnrJ/EryC1/StrS aminotransferase family protein [Desulfobacula sp.]|uniref:DegT/DnrJ/EryC1/StrS family aminotransferase n=1 Tax=Desulfobacula sp. TaxID=2593537 RepID=UPI0025BF544F|nr:DegT/DnrJ/EryC1/StrS family aminotransferase [Desulfobacula sp.]MBC2704243.1 DegT/DnrJ/EryC1/StrS family aminotransferase [Desulfobacula sp.]
MIKLAQPNISERAIKKVVEVLKSGNLVQGKYVEEFQQRLENYIGVRNAVVVSSGTAALHLALLALNLKKGDEVIVPAFTFPATANVVELVGAKPVFVDINLSDFCIDTSKIEEVITKRTKAIMPVHEFGQAAKMDDIVKITNHYNLKIVEDAACALGSEFNNQKVGTFGEFGCFSFHPRKAITTGEGGVVVTNDDILAKEIRVLRNHGIQNIDGRMDFSHAGLNYRMTDFQAALGLTQLQDIDQDITVRIDLANQYNMLLSDIEWIDIPSFFEDRKMVYQTYHILVGHKLNRDDLLLHLKENGIQANYGAQALNCIQFYMEKYNLTEKSYPKATHAYYKGVALPIGRHVSLEDVSFIVSEIDKISVLERN